ncbi:hypothetical protein CLPU_21c00070 [Gottschalkia purinilytica]|uniref:Uncharacterized protein n=1 Tax=Gottschalkia purinilytica TaxID=1503 RepID=A0A0L0W6P2_GOTPU|nr:hypothetical protein [Gottschalkia purinilytica]KNF07189.1 hypothetical protein CLPU_21c00070 [Gottschalkia purinilytica]
MISQKQLDLLIKNTLSQLGLDGDKDKKKKCRDKLLNLSPAQILVVTGILTDVLTIDSLLIDKDQKIQIVLAGSLKRKTELDKALDKIGKQPVDEVLKSIFDRLR